jgi:hypothetical protein
MASSGGMAQSAQNPTIPAQQRPAHVLQSLRLLLAVRPITK